ncbi:MAG: NADH-ubiquinone oxidoreductase subunit E family protein [Arcobacteraceae bacterium]|nr:NADH-ubiquinone oxidoreductase subunit E family protein [Arcobacteraceae bacterium]
MKRYDLRNHKENFIPRLIELMNTDIEDGENGIFIFEIGDFSAIQNVADAVKENKFTLMNSLKFNEVDWTVVVKKVATPVLEVETEEETAVEAK